MKRTLFLLKNPKLSPMRFITSLTSTKSHMRKFLVTMLLINSFACLACPCKTPANSTDADAFFQSSEYIIEGTFLGDLSTKSHENGTNIILKVSRVLKGDLRDKYVSIFQLADDECRQIFTAGNTYIIAADYFIRYECRASEQNASATAEESSPEPALVENDVLYTSKCLTKNRFDYWNRLIGQRTAFQSDDCRIFEYNSSAGQLILNAEQ